jgi:sulfotransferase
VRGKVELKPRQTILPPDLFKRCQDLTFWHDARGTKAYRIVVTPPAEEKTSPDDKEPSPEGEPGPEGEMS